MGVSLGISISGSVTEDEWEKTYVEVLTLLKGLPLADTTYANIEGHSVKCMVHSHECNIADVFLWHTADKQVGWCAVGDLNTLRTGESFGLPRKLHKRSIENTGHYDDAILGIAPYALEFGWKDDRKGNFISLWGGKTQGKPYHIDLLAIATLIEDRLGDKAFVYGDFTAGQCREARRRAAEVLGRSVIPLVSIDSKRLLKRIKSLPMTEIEKMRTFISYFCGKKDFGFGYILRSNFLEQDYRNYWKSIFADSEINTVGFSDNYRNYMNWGFDFEELISLVNFKSEYDGKPKYSDFINIVLRSHLYLWNKDCEDLLSINVDRDDAFDVREQMTYAFFLAGARNPNVDRYIPLENLKCILRRRLGDKCDTDRIIDEYIKEENNTIFNWDSLNNLDEDEYDKVIRHYAADVIRKKVETSAEIVNQSLRGYDICFAEDLITYKDGNTLTPKMEALLKYVTDDDERIRESCDSFGMNCYNPSKRRKFIASMAAVTQSPLLRMDDWNRIIEDAGKSYDMFLHSIQLLSLTANSSKKTDVYLAAVALLSNRALRERFR